MASAFPQNVNMDKVAHIKPLKKLSTPPEENFHHFNVHGPVENRSLATRVVVFECILPSGLMLCIATQIDNSAFVEGLVSAEDVSVSVDRIPVDTDEGEWGGGCLGGGRGLGVRWRVWVRDELLVVPFREFAARWRSRSLDFLAQGLFCLRNSVWVRKLSRKRIGKM